MAIALAVFEKKSMTVLSGITIKAEVSGLPLLDKRNIFAEYVEKLVENVRKFLGRELEKGAKLGSATVSRNHYATLSTIPFKFFYHTEKKLSIGKTV